MSSNILKSFLSVLLLCAFWFVAIPQAYAKKVPAAKPATLSQYVETKCITGCVDPDVLYMAAEAAGKDYDIDPMLLIAIASKESGFRPKAKNGSQKGLVQTHMRYHKKKYEGRSPYDPYANLDVGAEILKDCMDKTGSLSKALACYNGGGTKGYAAATVKIYREVKRLRVHSA